MTRLLFADEEKLSTTECGWCCCDIERDEAVYTEEFGPLCQDCLADLKADDEKITEIDRKEYEFENE